MEKKCFLLKTIKFHNQVLYFLAPGRTRKGSCGGGCPNKDVPEETQRSPVLSVQ